MSQLWTLKELKNTYPWITWEEPHPAQLITDNGLSEPHLICRICVANHGMKGGDILRWPTDLPAFEQHMREEHKYG